MVLVRVEELNTRSRVHFSTSYNQFHLYGTHVQVSVSRSIVRYERLSRPRSVPRSSQRQRRYRYRICACASRHARKDEAEKRPEPWRWWRERPTRRWKDHAMRARLADVDQITNGGLHTEGGSPRHHLQRCARMKDLTLGIQNHIGFMGSFLR